MYSWAYIFVSSPFLYLEVYVLSNGTSIRIFRASQTPIFSWSLSEIRVRLVTSNMFKPSSIFLLTTSRLDSFCWSFYFIYVFFAILPYLFLQPSGHLLGKGWPLDSLVCSVFLCVFFSLYHMVSGVRCGTWLYRFLNCAFFLTFNNYAWPRYHTFFVEILGCTDIRIKISKRSKCAVNIIVMHLVQVAVSPLRSFQGLIFIVVFK